MIHRARPFLLSVALLLALSAFSQNKIKVINDPPGTVREKIKAAEPAFVETMPQFSGDLSTFLSENLRYPDSARAHNQEGKVKVQFTVKETGLVDNIQVLQSSGWPLLDEEATRLIRLMQWTAYWKPGTQQGKPVAVFFTLPVTFKLN